VERAIKVSRFKREGQGRTKGPGVHHEIEVIFLISVGNLEEIRARTSIPVLSARLSYREPTSSLKKGG
jgi:hypothetical protein